MPGSVGQSHSASIRFNASRRFPAWLAERNASLAFTTYQAGKLIFVGVQPDGRLEIFNRSFARPMGLCATPQTLYLSTLYQLWRLENALGPSQMQDGYDRLFVPQIAWTTGDIDIHDVAVDRDGDPVFVSTLFSCLATVSVTHSLRPLWRPQFISKYAAEDRCHLNGLAIRDGLPRYVTSISRSDVSAGWRDHRTDGGCVIDVATDDVVVDGLSMPHSPRWYRDKLWVLNSGAGEFGFIDRRHGAFESIAFCPGYARGLAFCGDYAVIGLSKPRDSDSAFHGLSLQHRLEGKRAEPRCGLQIVDLRTGDTVHHLFVEGLVTELYDVGVIQGVRRPMAIGLKNQEIERVVSIEPTSSQACPGQDFE